MELASVARSIGDRLALMAGARNGTDADDETT